MTPEDTRYTSLSAVRVAILSLALSLFVGWRVFFPPAVPQPAAVTEPSAVTEARAVVEANAVSGASVVSEVSAE
jgi:hypothetical protein